tara:strand:+ start:18954 stop:19712 length:759 start_codon:yes stop_codon:yes gene_type:complete
MTHPLPNRPAVPVSRNAVQDEGKPQDIDEFIYLISHDVRSSVRALLELPQWIAEDLEAAGFEMGGQVETSIQLMNRHTARLDKMLMDLLTFSRIGRMQTTREINLDTALDEVLEELNPPKSFTIIRAFDCPVVTVGDRDIMTLLTALISNAIKHHDKPSGRVVITSVRDGGATVLAVSDDGPGIPEEFHEKVFGAMTTLRSRDEVEGSGLGLANVRKIAAQYGGRARLVASPYGRGSCIEVRMSQTPIGIET